MKIYSIPQPGDVNEDVRIFQAALNAQKVVKPKLVEDDNFGPKTRTAASQFQKSIGLEGTGIPGPKTIEALGLILDKAGQPVETPQVPFRLSWDNKAERLPWTGYIFSRLYEMYDSHIVKIKDMERFRIDWVALTKDQRIYVMAEIIVQMAKHESGWNPDSASVDVGNKDKKDTWSIGLLQLSVADQSWVKPRDKTRYTYEELIKPIPNLDLAFSILKRQIEKDGRLVLPNKSPLRYWAVMLDGNKYSKVDSIISVIKKIKIPEAVNEKLPSKDKKIDREVIARKIVAIIQADIDANLRETHGKNRSPRIDSFNKRAHAYPGDPYCASGGWCAIDDACKELGLKNPVAPTASSQAFRKTSFVPAKYIRPEGSKGKIGDVGVLQQVSDPGKGHYVTLREDQVSQPLFKTVEYNTDGSGSRDGDGAYAMTRSTVDRSAENSGKIFVCFTDIPQWIADHNKL